LRVYHSKLAELSGEAGLLMWGGKVIIPKSLIMKVLEELHREHMGKAKIKSLARSHVWWPGITKPWQSRVTNVLPVVCGLCLCYFWAVYYGHFPCGLLHLSVITSCIKP